MAKFIRFIDMEVLGQSRPAPAWLKAACRALRSVGIGSGSGSDSSGSSSSSRSSGSSGSSGSGSSSSTGGSSHVGQSNPGRETALDAEILCHQSSSCPSDTMAQGIGRASSDKIVEEVTTPSHPYIDEVDYSYSADLDAGQDFSMMEEIESCLAMFRHASSMAYAESLSFPTSSASRQQAGLCVL